MRITVMFASAPAPASASLALGLGGGRSGRSDGGSTSRAATACTGYQHPSLASRLPLPASPAQARPGHSRVPVRPRRGEARKFPTFSRESGRPADFPSSRAQGSPVGRPRPGLGLQRAHNLPGSQPIGVGRGAERAPPRCTLGGSRSRRVARGAYWPRLGSAWPASERPYASSVSPPA